MADFHHNIFYYYSGSSRSRDCLYDQQLEDNTTKALINTLRYCDKTVAIQFLDWLGIKTNSKVGFELQKPTIGRERIRSARKQRMLLGIASNLDQNSDIQDLNPKTPEDIGSRPDAWLFGDDFVVLIESKIGDASFDSAQMACHFRRLRSGTREKPTIVTRSWSEIHDFFSDLLSRSNEKNGWLMRQFTQYLEYQGMSDFTGFEEWMFAFFLQGKKDSKEKNLIRHTMEGFGEKILAGGVQALNPNFYEQSWLGNLSPKGDHFWVAFVPLGGPKIFAKKAHQTVSLSDQGLKVFINLESQHVINLLRKRIRNEDDKKQLVRLFATMPAPFNARVCRKVQRKDQPMKSDEYLLAELEGGKFDLNHPGSYGLKNPESCAFACFEKLVFEKNEKDKFEPAYVSIAKNIDRKNVLEMSQGNGEKLVREVVRIMQKFHPLVQFINDAESQNQNQNAKTLVR